MSNDVVQIDPGELTLKQGAFLIDYTGLTTEQIDKLLESGVATPKILIALLAISFNPTDPESALEEAEQTKVKDVKGLKIS